MIFSMILGIGLLIIGAFGTVQSLRFLILSIAHSKRKKLVSNELEQLREMLDISMEQYLDDDEYVTYILEREKVMLEFSEGYLQGIKDKRKEDEENDDNNIQD